MNWLNLKTSHLREPAFIGSEPVARATWLCVLSYCIELENGGRIAGARLWKDRQWQQACGVMLSEIQATTNLLTWDGDDLLVWNYPSDKEFEVQQMRELGRAKSAQKAEAARTNGLQGGRPKKEEKPNGNPTKNPTTKTQPNPTETHRKEGEGERKGKEDSPASETQEPDADPPPRPILPTLDQAKAYAPAAGVDPAAAECWWLDCEGRGVSPNGYFLDAKGTEIKSWKSAMTSYGRKWQSNDARFTQRNGTPVAALPPKLPDYIKTEWPAWLKSKGYDEKLKASGHRLEYEFAPELFKTEFHKERKAK